MASRVLVTGSRGLIGSRLLETNNLNTYVELPKSIDLLGDSSIGEVLEIAEVENVDAIVQLAWVSNSIDNYHHSIKNSQWTDFTVTLAKACVKKNIGFYGVSTCLTNSSILDSEYLKEKKRMVAELELEIESGQVAMFRPFFVLDEEFKRPSIYRNIKQSDFVLQSSKQENDYVHSKDVASAMAIALNEKLKGVIDLGSGTLRSNQMVVEAICRREQILFPTFLNEEKPNGPLANMEALVSLGWVANATNAFFA